MNMSAGNDAADQEYAEFESASTVEVGDDGTGTKPADSEPKPKPSGRGPKEPAAKSGIEVVNDGAPIDGEDDDDDDLDEDATKRQEGHVKRLKRERMEAKSEVRALKERLAALEGGSIADRLAKLENGDLPNGKTGGNSADIGKAPDPQDSDKYPLGHLDDRYIEEKLDWLADQKAARQAEAVLQRQQENEQNAALTQQREELLEKVDDLASRGADVSDDFQEAVVEAGMRGDWKLSQPTFEAAHEAEHGAQILYDLSQDKREAARVAALSPYQQTKFVLEKNAELLTKSTPRTKPGAGAPPQTQTRGANSRTRINPATDNLDDFEKAWEAEAKGKRN